MSLQRRLRFELNEIIGFFVEPTWGYPVALYRILYGLLATWTSAFLFPNLARYYTEAGRMPWAKVKHFPEHAYSVLALDPTSLDYVRMLAWVQLGAAILITVGLFSRVGALTVFLLQVAFQHRNPYVLNSGDHLFLLSAFLLMFAPIENRLSLRNLIERRMRPERYKARFEKPVSGWSTRLIGLQICYVYLYAFAAKVNSPVWLKGTAMYDVFASPSLARWPAEVHQPVPLALITWGTLAFELAFPLLVWQKPFRRYVILAGVLFHVGIEATMALPMFSWLMMYSYTLFLDDAEAQAVVRFFRRPLGWFGPVEPSPAIPEDMPHVSTALDAPLALSGVMKDYAWGSKTALADILGRHPSGGPEAEYWLGAHPSAPAVLARSGQDLVSAIASQPTQALGPVVQKRFGSELPFLLKLLSADEPLSLQAHPSRKAAEDGFLRERALGLVASDPKANYKDPNPKPELVCALSEFRVLFGFSDLKDALVRAQALGLDSAPSPFGELVRRGQGANEEEFRQSYLQLALTLPAGDVHEMVTTLARRAEALAVDGPLARFYARLGELAQRYPDDGGVLVAVLMNYLELKVGEALFLPEGTLHAYLGGTAIEVMASSDNVLRGGLTKKHVDVAELGRVLGFGTSHPEVLSPRAVSTGSARLTSSTYSTDAEEFELSIVELGPENTLSVVGPGIGVVLRGQVRLGGLNSRLELARGAACFVPHAAGEVALEAQGESSRFVWVQVPKK
jgi:mannose-6-phosphate isomerase